MTCLLVNLDSSAAAQLEAALVALECPVVTEGSGQGHADLVFCGARSPSLPGLLRNRPAPVVVVGSEPTEEAWVQAIEAGAADYLCAGFELAELRWILRNQESIARTAA